MILSQLSYHLELQDLDEVLMKELQTLIWTDNQYSLIPPEHITYFPKPHPYHLFPYLQRTSSKKYLSHSL